MKTAPIQATLIHNANAGGAGSASSEDLLRVLHHAGFRAEHRETSSADDLDAALEQPGDLVVAAGGDGTIRAVASRLAGRGVPMAVLPMGTANNLGASLGLVGSPLELAAGLAQAVIHPFDLGRVRGPWGEDVFLEAAGVGLFAAMMAAYGPDDGKSPLRALSAIAQTVPGYAAIPCKLALDGVERHADLVLLEVMNTPATGPRLRLAPDADPGDGWLEVVSIEADGRVGLMAYLTNLIAGRLDSLPNVTVTRARRLRLEWSGSALHFDTEVRHTESKAAPENALTDETDAPLTAPSDTTLIPGNSEPPSDLQPEPLWAEFWLEPGALEVWLPAPRSETTVAAAAEVKA